MITPAIKDKVLAAIVSHAEEIFLMKPEEVFPNKEISKRQFELILLQFEEMGLLRKAERHGTSFLISISANIYDFFNHGGFVVQEELLRANLQKLDYELTKLAKEINPGLTDRIANITGIAASIATALGLFKG
ncbi:hypothetical protein LK518_09105 [Parabacteroides distasonis]|uniref:hypothetical protein n=1 Tax=Parabacteroides distasonis TaxID=823 RepID=UPI001D0FEAF7|nr:hypothetical protein [Parabacteroides distasonis]MCC2779572.1 hypothetical protein [Parabacteroides distasonis]MCQ5178680.1 hypothetical protein [Parabacteroides distasonis]WMI44355.1 hypothetical protein Q8809_08490 [Parabacteroides distasonis]